MLGEKVVVTWFARANNGIMDDDFAALDSSETDTNLELKNYAEKRKLHIIANVHDILQMLHGSQNVCAKQKDSPSQNMQMSAVQYISDTEEIIKASRSNFQQNGAAAFKMSERSPLPPALSGKNISGGRTEVLNVCPIGRIVRHPTASDKDSAPDSISDSEYWLNWNDDLDNPNGSEDDNKVHNESDTARCNGMKASKSPVHCVVIAAPNVPGFIWPTWREMKQADKGLVTVSATDTRRNMGKQETVGLIELICFHPVLYVS